MYCRHLEDNPDIPDPEGRVSFNVRERAARVALWMNQNFLMGDELEPDDGRFEIGFSSLRQPDVDLKIKV